MKNLMKKTVIAISLTAATSLPALAYNFSPDFLSQLDSLIQQLTSIREQAMADVQQQQQSASLNNSISNEENLTGNDSEEYADEASCTEEECTSEDSEEYADDSEFSVDESWDQGESLAADDTGSEDVSCDEEASYDNQAGADSGSCTSDDGTDCGA